MSGSVNKVILIGNLGKDPEIRAFQNGGRVASFSVATSESWKDKTTGEKKDRTEWHRVSVLNDALVGVVEKYIKKGMKVYIEGQLETRKWTDKDGADKYATEIVLRPFRGELTILEAIRNGSSQDSDELTSSSPAYKASSAPLGDLDDSIPF